MTLKIIKYSSKNYALSHGNAVSCYVLFLSSAAGENAQEFKNCQNESLTVNY